jgi:fibro-slime domain-containing protein
LEAPVRKTGSSVLLLWFVLAGALGCAKVAGTQSGAGGTGGDPGMAGAGGTDAGSAAGSMDGDDAPSFDVAPPAVCGNAIVEIGETCDDGNTVSGDGCSSTCQIEPHFTCPTPGKPCVHDVVCGDGIIEGTEECDDGNTKSGDGCSATCMLECGWVCPPGVACRAAKCGDGKVAGNEQCDDGNTVDGDGCSSLCTLESKPPSQPEGWLCTTPAPDAMGCKGPTSCTTTKCGNGVKEGTEQCDDANDVTGDGCSPFCRLEPVCPPAGGACSTVCGSGLLLPGDTKQCDDGNTVGGDGCSADCKIEPGYVCKPVPVSQNPLVLPIVYHDFQSWKDPSGHPDFEHYLCSGMAGIAQPALGTANGGVPVHVPMCMGCSSNLCMPPAGATPAWDPMTDWFGMWYVDMPTYNKPIVQTLTLGGQVNGAASATCNVVTGQPACTSFQYSSTAFFPIDGMGWGNTPGQGHNFGFTSVARYWFEYTGTATLTFFGDDDVFVYINKKLAVDLGGTHQRAEGGITLDPANGTGYSCDFVAPGSGGINGLAMACDSATQTGGGHVINLGLAMGSVYEIAVFQAERHTTESNYQLTLGNFSGTKSVCMGACGDGVVTPPEQCDLGAAMNTGAYGGCNPDCTLAPYCGDKIVQAADGEQCDSTPNCDKNCKLVVIP